MTSDTSPRNESRTPLSRERVLRAAVAFADDSGLESLSMRKLGQLLGVEAMSLYNHVANKDDLLRGMAALVMSEIEPPPQDGPWDAAIRRSAVSAHAVLEQHTWASSLLLSASGISERRIEYMDALLARLSEAGFSADQVYSAYHALDAHIFGFALWQAMHARTAATHGREEIRRLVDAFPVDDYPYVAEHIRQHMEEGKHREVSAFELTLDLILDGLRRMLNRD